MITKPGWYMFEDSWSFSILQVFEYFPKGECWSYNTLYSRESEEKSLSDEDAFIFEESAMHEISIPILEYKHRERLFNYIFVENNRFVIGNDYKRI